VHGARETAELLQHEQPPCGEDPGGGLHDGVEQTGHAPAGLHDGAVGEGEVALLLEAVPGHRERQVLEEGRLAVEDVVDHRLDVGPDVDPDVRHPLAEGIRVP
jgi:hypothetical protein